MGESIPISNKAENEVSADKFSDVYEAVIDNNLAYPVIITDQPTPAPIDHSDFLPINFLQKGLNLQRCVAKILLKSGGCATGFLIAPNLLITNNHVLPSEAIANTAKFQFNYQQDVNGSPEIPMEYSANTEIWYTNSLFTYDFTIVGVAGNPGKQWGYTTLLNQVRPVPGKNCIIIQFPEGNYKQIVIHNSLIIESSPNDMKYTADALEGSSGSPIFDDSWRLIGIHQTYGDLKENPSVGIGRYKNNKGISIQTIMDDLKMHSRLESVQKILRELHESANL